MTDRLKCFVIMDFDREMDVVYSSAIERAAEDKGYECSRADSSGAVEDIPDHVIRSIYEADVVIADVSNGKLNVIFELGIAFTFPKPTICISKTRDLPLDIRNYRVHFYEMDHLESLRLKLSERLDHLDEFRSNPIVNSARPHFDFREAIAKNLDAAVEERRRATELREFTELRWADNEAVADSLIQQMWNAIGLESRKSIIAISGAGSIGKSTFAKLLVDRMEIKLPNRSFEILPTDSYMLDRASRIAQNITGFNIESHDMMACGRDLSELIAGNSVKIRPYDHTTGKHAEERTIIAPDILILEGIHSFHPPIDKQLDFRIFIYSSKPVVKALKYMADYFERGYSPIDSFQHSEVEYVDYENYVLPYYRNANSVIDVTGYWRYRLGDLRGEFTEGSYAEKQNSSN